jgi:membrane associated rhomboid family serine protease
MFKTLFKSRKVVLALVGIAQTLVAHYLEIPVEVWASIDGLIVAVIGGIAVEDAAEKRNEAAGAVRAVKEKAEEL